MRFRLALGVSAMVGALALPAAAQAVPGDRAISDPAPGQFRLDRNHLEPGCFDLGRAGYWFSNIDASSFDVQGDRLADGEVVLKNNTGSHGPSFDIDQVLVPSRFGGYKVSDTFDVGSGANESAPVISNGETGTEIFGPDSNGNGNPDPIDANDIIVCLSDDSSMSQNEPYAQETDGLVSAVNRPVIQPKVTALGASAIAPLNTYKVGFGYSTPTWYAAPTFDGHGLFAAVTDPEASAFAAPFGIPQVVRLRVRGDGHPYDSRRVNDVDKAGESWAGPDADDGQDIYLRNGGDDTAWTDSNGNGLLTTLTQGDLPIRWTVRPSLAAPGSLHFAELADADLRAWNTAWQKFYKGQGPNPLGNPYTLPPGTNSPAPETSVNVIVNMPVTASSSGAVTPMTPAQVVVYQAAAKKAAKKAATAKQRAAYKRCAKKANKKHGKKSRSKARAKCARMPH